jgi:hypothetical protein
MDALGFLPPAASLDPHVATARRRPVGRSVGHRKRVAPRLLRGSPAITRPLARTSDRRPGEPARTPTGPHRALRSARCVMDKRAGGHQASSRSSITHHARSSAGARESRCSLARPATLYNGNRSAQLPPFRRTRTHGVRDRIGRPCRDALKGRAVTAHANALGFRRRRPNQP